MNDQNIFNNSEGELHIMTYNHAHEVATLRRELAEVQEKIDFYNKNFPREIVTVPKEAMTLEGDISGFKEKNDFRK